ncbi:MAG: shikimate dehydrogenase [Elusimicrobia bacterium]|nr:shikimate dehydrogenase [Elusimicrobiota bacterium]
MKNEIKKVGLVGWPVKHSLSPALHNACFEKLGLSYRYDLYPVPPENLGKEIEKIKDSLAGFNITIPHKERITDFLDESDSSVSQIGAANCAFGKDGRWTGFNTDVSGFLKALRQDFDPYGENAFVLGAGGAARAVSFALARAAAKKIYIYDIEKEKAEKLAARLKKFFPGGLFFAASDFSAVAKCRLLVNATPVGMEKDEIPIDVKFLYNQLYVFDLVYNRKTLLLREAEERGLKCRNGMDMLIYQAAESFRIWTGIYPPVDEMRKAVGRR